jgi:hypothetical protein
MFQIFISKHVVSTGRVFNYSTTSIRAMDSRMPCTYSASLSGRGCNLNSETEFQMRHICMHKNKEM